MFGAMAPRRFGPIGFHVTMRLADDRPIATTMPDRRTLARVVLGQGSARGLLAFGAADNHLHAELATDRETAGAFCRYVGSALRGRLRLAVPFEPARIRPLEDQRHAYATFRYALRQDARHDLHLDPAREGTSLPDLLGLRVLDASLVGRVRRHLPRVQESELAAALPPGLQQGDIDLAFLADAAAAAFALADLRSRQLHAVHARRAAVHAVGRLPVRSVADALCITPRAVHLLRLLPTDTRAVDAVRRQARLRAALARQASRAAQ